VILTEHAPDNGLTRCKHVPYDETSTRIKLFSADSIMRIAYLDCFSGISGDMFLGALVDAGVSPQLLAETVAALDLGARLEISRVNRSGISATKVDVYTGDEKDVPREQYWSQREQESHSHLAHHKHDHKHPHDHPPQPVALVEHNYAAEDGSSRAGTPAPHKHEPHKHESHEHGRGLTEIREIIRKASISEPAKKTATAIFQALGEAEAKIHNTDIESIHFHEVGAVDAMVDIVCAAVAAESLAVDEIICSPLNVGGGTVKCAHGTFPIPAPATVELLKHAPVYSSGIQAELVTPTGAAIVSNLVKRFASFPRMSIERAGYGAGTRDFDGHANVLRLTVGEALSEKTSQETISVLEANLDDLNPQVFGYVMDRLLEEGALDVFGMPVQMKKNRPGMLLTILCRPEHATKLSDLVFAETTTLGIRQREEQRQVLARKWITVRTRWGEVRMKVASMKGTVTNYAPEYEDCRRLAAEHHVALKNVMQEAVQEYVRSGPTKKSE
jgi:pyridinium-3,5-bisthiocarboxylic acid mononucleotide nickel chelatase